MSVLSNFDIETILKEEQCPAIVCCRDELIRHVSNNKFIINYDLSTQEGSHWVALYIYKDTGFYVDSYGRKPLPEIIEYLILRGCTQCCYNDQQIQHNSSIDCGWFAVYALLMFENMKIKSMHAYIAQFNKRNFKKNDELLIQRFHKLIN